MTDVQPGIGHNEPPAEVETPQVGREARERLRGYVKRIERLQADRAKISADIREVISEAKSAGFDAKTLRNVLALRKVDPATRRMMDELRRIYLNALGMK